MARRAQTRTLVAAVLAASLFSFGAPAMAARKADVRLVPSVSSVAPGEPFEVAIEFNIKNKWHIYWKNSGDSGAPPKVSWKLPAGFRAGPLRFPIPTRHVGRANIITNIHEGKPILLATITSAADLRSLGRVTIAADLNWLVCEKQCLQESKSVSLTLPVVASAAAVKPANQDVFKRARQALPVAQAKYVAIKPYLAKGKLAPESIFHVNLDVQIEPGLFIHSDKPRVKSLPATEVFLDPAANVYFDPPEYPQATVKTVSKLGEVAGYEGKITISIAVEADEELPGDSRTIGGLFVYQACDTGTGDCHPREAVQWSLTIPMGQVRNAAPDDQPAHAEVPPTDTPAGSPTETGPQGSTSDQPVTAPAALSEGSTVSPDEDQGLTGLLQGLGLPGLLLACFFYGLFLNATPCVLPVLSIKVLGFVQQAHESRRRTFALGLAFGFGVLLVFVALGFLAAGGRNLLQYPPAVIGLGTVVMVLALSMLGVYTLQVPTTASKLEASIQREGVLSSFGKGALAPVLGFACTGPLLAGAFGWATQQPPRIAVFAFLFTGLGMASPYMLLGANPNWLRFIPKPGQWMVTFERVMGFLLLAMVIWLLSPLVTQIGAPGLEWTLVFLVAVALACWVVGRIDFSMSAARRWRYRGGAATIVVLAGVLVYGLIYPLAPALERQRAARWARYAGDDWSIGMPWRQWSEQAVDQAVRSGKTVFVDFTSASCTNCKANKILAINTPQVHAKMRDLGVALFQGDFTFTDLAISAALKKHGRPGVPMNLIYPAGKPHQPILMPVTFGQDRLLKMLDQAGPSTGVSARRGSRETPSGKPA